MTDQDIPATSLSGPPVSRWLGFFPEFRTIVSAFCCAVTPMAMS